MGSPSSTPTDLNQWGWLFLKGVPTPGSIPRGGIRGFKRETGWDEQKGKGTKGATLILKSAPPVKGSIMLQLIGPGGFYYWGGASTDFAQWDNFVANVLSITPEKQKAEGLTISYPAFASIGLTSVVVAHYSAPEHVGKGLYEVTIDLIEWTSPPSTSIVSKVESLVADAASTGSKIAGQDPEVKSLQAQIAAAQQAATP